MATTHRIPGLVVTEHEVTVPLDHARPDGERITLYAREVADPGGRDRPFRAARRRGRRATRRPPAGSTARCASSAC